MMIELLIYLVWLFISTLSCAGKLDINPKYKTPLPLTIYSVRFAHHHFTTLYCSQLYIDQNLQKLCKGVVGGIISTKLVNNTAYSNASTKWKHIHDNNMKWSSAHFFTSFISFCIIIPTKLRQKYFAFMCSEEIFKCEVNIHTFMILSKKFGLCFATFAVDGSLVLYDVIFWACCYYGFYPISTENSNV